MFPGGSNGEFGLPPRLTPVILDCSGCTVCDGDGREYLDLTLGWGSMLIGHGHPGVTAAVVRPPATASESCCARPCPTPRPREPSAARIWRSPRAERRPSLGPATRGDPRMAAAPRGMIRGGVARG
ncbi:MAG: aminotransferase class III-fold pyridoxal phosphate-dependent enzyme [Planctomycetes bacterium]|nr:aminotransferase class III-fold pyridoxal phosphate-dependent enzyme [Planctomycetota bacterium]